MKKEDIIIEVNNDVLSKIGTLSSKYELDLEHLSFKKFTINDVLEMHYKNIDVLKDIKENSRNIFPNISEEKINATVKSLLKEKNISIKTEVEVNDKEVNIKSDFIDLTLVFKDYIFKPSDSFEDALLEIRLNEEKGNRYQETYKKCSNEYDNNLEMITVQTIHRVLGILIYFQLPNKVNFIEKSSRLEVKGKTNKKKSKANSKKIYLYKTTYKIKDIDNELDEININTRTYNRKVNEWVARGHWRTLRDGRKIWIKQSIRKSKTPVNNAEITSTNYKITSIDI